jgi:hypothetical protein
MVARDNQAQDIAFEAIGPDQRFGILYEPPMQSAIAARRPGMFVIGIECGGENRFAMIRVGGLELSGLGIENPHELVATRGDQAAPIRTPAHIQDPICMLID